MFAFLKPPLPIGTPAPAFNMLDNTGRLVKSSDLIGHKSFVLVFYPADFSMVCTTQLCEFRERYSDLQAQGVEVFGVNPFNWETHQKFAEQNKLPFKILLDPHCKYAEFYNAVLIPNFINKRVVYGVDKTGNICFAQNGKPKVELVLNAFTA